LLSAGYETVLDAIIFSFLGKLDVFGAEATDFASVHIFDYHGNKKTK
jgi:hypothetical protein